MPSKKTNKAPVITKQKMLDTFLSNVNATLTINCCICEATFEEEEEGFIFCDSLKSRIEEVTTNAYKAGWRESVSEVFGHVGIHCPDCHKNRNNSNYFN